MLKPNPCAVLLAQAMLALWWRVSCRATMSVCNLSAAAMTVRSRALVKEVTLTVDTRSGRCIHWLDLALSVLERLLACSWSALLLPPRNGSGHTSSWLHGWWSELLLWMELLALLSQVVRL